MPNKKDIKRIVDKVLKGFHFPTILEGTQRHRFKSNKANLSSKLVDELDSTLKDNKE